MRRDYLIALILAVAAFPLGAALMVAPEYLHLSGAAIPLTFWGGLGITLALIIAAAIIAARGEARALHESQPEPREMTTGETSFLVGYVAASVSIVAAIYRRKAVAVIAAAVACIAVFVDVADRRGYLGLETAEIKIEPSLDEDQGKMLIDIFGENSGFGTAIGSHWQTGVPVVEKPFTATEIDAAFEYMKTLAKEDDKKNFTVELAPGDSNFVTAEKFSMDQFSKIINGGKTLYIFALVKYRDKTLPPDKWAATEACFYAFKTKALHLCEHHNRVRVFD